MTVETPHRPDRTSEELEALIEEARRRARRRRLGYAAGAAILALVIAGVLLLGGGGDDAAKRPDGPNVASTAGGAERDVLFARARVGSREGLFEIDLAAGEIEPLRLRMSCGDTPFCLISTGGELVIGSVGRTTAYDPAAPGRPQAARLGDGWITVPSARDGRVWLGMLAPGRLGGPHRRGLSAVREVDLDGRVLRSMRPPRGLWPAAAVTSGLLFQYPQSLRLWSLEERGFTLRIPGAFPVDTSGSLVASCGEPCSKLALTDTRTGEITRVAPPDGRRWSGGYVGAFSPDASHVALPVNNGLGIVDVRGGHARVIPGSAEVDADYRAMAWSSEGDRLFFVADDGTVLSYRVGSQSPTAHASFDSNDLVFQMVSLPK